MYISLKMFKEAGNLMKKINSKSLLNQLAKMKETELKFDEAEDAYERADNWQAVIRINLSRLNNFEKAEKILREKCPIETCANMLA